MHFFTTVMWWLKVNFQLSFRTQSSILYHFTNLYFISIVRVLFAIHYPLEKHFREGYIFIIFLESQNLCSLSWATLGITQKIKFSINNFFSKCDQICSFLRIWSHLLKKSLMGNFIFCEVGGILSVTNQTNSNHKTHLLSKNRGEHQCLE